MKVVSKLVCLAVVLSVVLSVVLADLQSHFEGRSATADSVWIQVPVLIYENTKASTGNGRGFSCFQLNLLNGFVSAEQIHQVNDQDNHDH